MHKISEWNKLDLKGKVGGKIQTTCPECSESRKKRTEKCVSINITEGFAKCNHCDTLFFKDENSNKAISDIKYTLPIQELQNYTELPDNLVKWFKKRGISQNTLIENKITYENAYFGQFGEKTSMCFNYFEGSVLVDKKFRSKEKLFSGAKNAKKVFYNLNNIISCDEIYICEGEIDALSLYEIGVTNAISLPNGANDNDTVWINCEKYLKDVKKFYIATDNDEAGDLVAEKIAQRLGRYRCERVLFEGKDANEDLVSEVLEKSIKNTYKYPVAGTYGIDDLWQSMLDTINEGPPLVMHIKKDWCREFNKFFGIMESQLTVVTGVPSHGKSSFFDWYTLNLSNDYNKKVSWFSPEHGENKRYMIKLATKAIGKNFYKCTDSERLEFREWAKERIYLTSADMGVAPTWDWIFETFKEQMFRYGVNIFVVDAFNKLELPKGDKLEQMGKVLMKLSAMCIQYNINIILVAHPTKMGVNEVTKLTKVPELYDISGSADFRNQTHNGVSVYRYFTEGEERTEVYNLKVKDTEYQGVIGGFSEFEYNLSNGRYHRMNGPEDNLPLWHSNEVVPEPFIEKIPLDKLNDVFDFNPNYNDELPF